MSNVINFIPHFEQKKNRQRIEEELNASGWEITDEINCLDSDFCVYLMDTKEQCVILFGAKLESLPLTGGASIDWHHFVVLVKAFYQCGCFPWYQDHRLS